MGYPVAYRTGSEGRGSQAGPSVAFLDTSRLPPEGAVAARPQETGAPGAAIPPGVTAAGIIGAVREWLGNGMDATAETPDEVPDREFPPDAEGWGETWGSDWPDRGEVEDDVASEYADVTEAIFGIPGFKYLNSCKFVRPPWYTGPDCGWNSTTNSTCAQLATACSGINPAHSFVGWYAFAPGPPRRTRDGAGYARVQTDTVIYPARVPMIIPLTVDPLNVPEPDEEPLAVPAPWNLPLRAPAEVAPWPVSWPGRPMPKKPATVFGDPRSLPRPGFAIPGVTGPVIGPGTGVIITPDLDGDGATGEPIPQPEPRTDTTGRTTSSLANPSPPRAREREHKPDRKPAILLKAMVNMATEWADFVDALWKALPKEHRKPCRDHNGKRRKCSVLEKVEQLGDALYRGAMNDYDYWREAFIQLATNEIVDFGVGKAGQAYAKASRAAGFDQGRGWQTGGGARRGNSGYVKGMGSASDTVEGVVRWAVDRSGF